MLQLGFVLETRFAATKSIPGSELSGIVEAIGAEVSGLLAIVLLPFFAGQTTPIDSSIGNFDLLPQYG